jgi:hypothetical protein
MADEITPSIDYRDVHRLTISRAFCSAAEMTSRASSNVIISWLSGC